MHISVWAIVACMLAAGLTGCSAQPASQVRTGSSVSVDPSATTTLRAPGGPTITLPRGSISAPGQLSVHAATSTHEAGLTLHGWTISLTGSKLTGTAQIAFPIHLASGEPLPLIGSTEQAGGRLMPAAGVRDGDTVVVTTHHFSSWFLVTFGQVLASMGAAIKRFVSPTHYASAPTCSQQTAAFASQFLVVHTVSNAVLWCVGPDDSQQPKITVANDRGYPMTVEATAGLKTSDAATTLDNFFPKLLTSLQAREQRSDTVHLLASGEQQSFDNRDTTRAQGVNLTVSTGALLASDAMFAAQTLLLLLDHYAPKTPTIQGFVHAADSTGCLVDIFGSGTPALANGKGVAAYLSTVMPKAFSCLQSQIEEEFGDLGIVTTAVLAGASWLISGLQLFFNSVVAVADTLTHLDTNAVTVSALQPADTPTASPAITDEQLAICIQHQQQTDGSPVSAHPTRADLMKLTRLDCPAPAHIHGWTIDFTELAYATNLTFLRFWSDAPPDYEDLSPLAKLTKLTALYQNLGRCKLPIKPVGGTCVYMPAN